RLPHKVTVDNGAPAKPAAEEHGVDFHLLGFETGSLRRRSAVHGLKLGTGPHVAAVGTHVGDAVERLHRRVGEVGQLINCFEFLSGAAHRGRNAAFLSGYGPGCLASSAYWSRCVRLSSPDSGLSSQTVSNASRPFKAGQ